MNKNIAKWMTLAALLMFVTATFQIANSNFISGAIFFGSAVCFTAAAGKYRDKEKKEKQEGAGKQ